MISNCDFKKTFGVGILEFCKRNSISVDAIYDGKRYSVIGKHKFYLWDSDIANKVNAVYDAEERGEISFSDSVRMEQDILHYIQSKDCTLLNGTGISEWVVDVKEVA